MMPKAITPWTPTTDQLTAVPDETLAGILQQGTECLAATVNVGFAADQRANALCSIFGGAALALLAGAATVAASDLNNRSLIAAACGTAAILVVASILAGVAGRAVDFQLPGYEPKRLFASPASLAWMQRYVCVDVQFRIDQNRRALEKSAALTNWSLVMAALSLVAGFLILCLLGIFPGQSPS